MKNILEILEPEIRNRLDSNSINKICSSFHFQSVPSDQLSHMTHRMGELARALGGAPSSPQANNSTGRQISSAFLKLVLTPSAQQLESASISIYEIKEKIGNIAVIVEQLDIGTINYSQTLIRRIPEVLRQRESFKELPSGWQEFVLDICSGRIDKDLAANNLREFLGDICSDHDNYLQTERAKNSENPTFSLGGSDLIEKLINLGKSGYVVCYYGENVILCPAFRDANNPNFRVTNYGAVPAVLDQRFVAFPIKENPDQYNIFLRPEATQPRA